MKRHGFYTDARKLAKAGLNYAEIVSKLMSPTYTQEEVVKLKQCVSNALCALKKPKKLKRVKVKKEVVKPSAKQLTQACKFDGVERKDAFDRLRNAGFNASTAYKTIRSVYGRDERYNEFKQQARELFEEGLKPIEVIHRLRIPSKDKRYSMAYHYYAKWVNEVKAKPSLEDVYLTRYPEPKAEEVEELEAKPEVEEVVGFKGYPKEEEVKERFITFLLVPEQDLGVLASRYRKIHIQVNEAEVSV